MTTALRSLVTATTLGVGFLLSGQSHADGPYGDDGYYEEQQPPQYPGDPNAQYGQAPNGQIYQPPPEGTCFDDNNQAYDCSNDTEFASYGQLDDGYDSNAYLDFRDTLSPYGNWISTEQYGQVWVPAATVVGTDFTPYYTGGRWAMTDYGWTWVSDYNWGWGPFHYGRWITVGSHGWCWVPGRIWGPAWVHWRLGGGYVGWAPLPPRGVRIAQPWGGGVGVRFHHWNFVPMAQLTSPRLVRVAPTVAGGLYARTTIASDLRAIGSTRIVYGPPLHHFAGASIRISPAPLHNVQIAMPRASIVARPGLALTARPYYAPAYRQGFGVGRPMPGAVRPGAPSGGYQPAPGYPRPGGFTQPAPGYPRPGGFTQPAPSYPRPGGFTQPAPSYPRPGGFTQPAPGYPRPGYPQPSTINPVPNYPRPGYPQPAPAYQNPGYPRLGNPHPSTINPAPAFPRPTYQPPASPAPAYQPPAYPQPNHPAPPFQRPASHPPTYHAPAPTYHAPAPTYHAPPPAPHAPVHSPGGPSGGGRHH